LKEINNSLRMLKLLIFVLNTAVYFAFVCFLEDGLPSIPSVAFQYLFFYAALVLSLYAFRGYDYIFGMEPEEIVASSAIGVLLAAILTVAFVMLFQRHMPRVNFVLIVLFFLVWSPLSRVLIFKIFKSKFPVRKVVVLGKREQWEPLMVEISKKTNNKVEVVGWVDALKQGVGDFNGCTLVVADPSFAKDEEIQDFLKVFQLRGGETVYLPVIVEEILKRIPLEVAETFKNYYELAFEMVRVDPWQRALDIAFCLITLPITAPLGLLIAFFIMLDSGFPIIFRQPRVGLNGDIFTMHKFRSMVNSPKKGAGFADDHACYITRVGKVLRKFRIDEILQFWDVFRGKMSVIGPRPEQPEFEANFVENIPFYKYRRKLRPGITGWAQINFSYASDLEETEKKLEYDLYYVKNRNILLDLQIALRTAEVMFLMRGAR